MLPAYYFIGLGIIVSALGYVAWLLWDEKRKETPQTSPDQTTPRIEPPSVTPQSLLSRLGLKKDSSSPAPATTNEEVPAKPKTRNAFTFSNLKEKFSFLNKSDKRKAVSTPQIGGGGIKNLLSRFTGLLNKKKITPPTAEEGTASLRLDQLDIPAAESGESSPQETESPVPPSQNILPLGQDNISAESELSLQLDESKTKFQELNEKYQKLETLFTEKSQDLEKTEKTLINERKTHKEFNKLKDLLEKDVKDSKDKSRQLQNDVANAQTEIQTHIKRITQLEEKVKTLEKDILTKDDQNKDLQIDRQKYQNQLKELEETARQKDAKIENLVNLMKQEQNKASAEPPAHAAETVSAEHANPVINQEPPAAPPQTEEQPPAVSAEPLTPVEPPEPDKNIEQEVPSPHNTPESDVPQNQNTDKPLDKFHSAEREIQTQPDPSPANQSAPAVSSEPSNVSDSDETASANDHPKLAPDIFTNSPQKPDKSPDDTQGTTDKQT